MDVKELQESHRCYQCLHCFDEFEHYEMILANPPKDFNRYYCNEKHEYVMPNGIKPCFKPL